MPTYVYRCACGVQQERVAPMGRAPRRVRCTRCRAAARRDYRGEQVQRSGEHGYPYFSDTLGVHPDQIPEATAELAAHGIRAEFDADGGLRIDSRSHRRRICEALGFGDKDAGYSDRAPLRR